MWLAALRGTAVALQGGAPVVSYWQQLCCWCWIDVCAPQLRRDTQQRCCQACRTCILIMCTAYNCTRSLQCEPLQLQPGQLLLLLR